MMHQSRQCSLFVSGNGPVEGYLIAVSDPLLGIRRLGSWFLLSPLTPSLGSPPFTCRTSVQGIIVKSIPSLESGVAPRLEAASLSWKSDSLSLGVCVCSGPAGFR